MKYLHMEQSCCWAAADTGLSLAPPQPTCAAEDGFFGLGVKRSEAARRPQEEHAGLLHNVELQQRGPLPLGWEQCLDLQTGDIYYYNPALRTRTRQDPRGGFAGGAIPNEWNPKQLDPCSKENWFRKNSYTEQLRRMNSQQDQAAAAEGLDRGLDLTLNLSSYASRRPAAAAAGASGSVLLQQQQQQRRKQPDEAMIALPCRHCRMLVMLPRTFPQCPNCGQPA